MNFSTYLGRTLIKKNCVTRQKYFLKFKVLEVLKKISAQFAQKTINNHDRQEFKLVCTMAECGLIFFLKRYFVQMEMEPSLNLESFQLGRLSSCSRAGNKVIKSPNEFRQRLDFFFFSLRARLRQKWRHNFHFTRVLKSNSTLS